MSSRPCLVIMSGDMSGRRIEVPQAGLRVGRSSSNDVHIPDEELSRNHCIFECDGENAIRVIDLASANGTYVNGEQLGAEPRVLKAGDTVDVGATRIRIAGENEPVVFPQRGGAVDLGLGAQPSPAAPEKSAAPADGRHKVVNILWAAAVGILIGAIALMLLAPSKRSGRPAAGSSAAGKSSEAVNGILALSYERIAADATHIFRYAATIDESGAIHVLFGDVPSENRRMEKTGELSALSRTELARIFDSQEWQDLSGPYTGPSVESENALRSWRLKIVRDGSVKEVSIANTQEPEGFAMIRERLETLINNELGVQSIQRTRDELVASSEHSEEVGDAKWDERDVEYGNLSECIRCYRSAKNDLATVTSSSEAVQRIQSKLERAEAELKRRYDEVRFEAERARQIGDWERARGEFGKLCEMIPDRGDPRHAEARANMVDVENRLDAMRKGGKN